MRMYKPLDEFETAPESYVPGRYLMRIKNATEETSKDLRAYFKVVNEIVEGPAATAANGTAIDYTGREFTDIVWQPDPQRQPEEWMVKAAERKMSQFLDAYQIPFTDDEVVADDFAGAEAWVTLGVRKNSDMLEAKKYEQV